MLKVTEDLELVLPLSTFTALNSLLSNPAIERKGFVVFLKYRNKTTLLKVINKLRNTGIGVEVPKDLNLYDTSDIKESMESHVIISKSDWKAPALDETQEQGVIAMTSLMKFINMDDTGTGKTYQSITSLNPKFRQGLLDFLLILAPMKVVGKWRREILQFGTFAREDEIQEVYTGGVNSLYDLIGFKVLIMSYDTFNTLVKKELKVLKRGKGVRSKPVFNFDRFGKKLGIILDEAHKIKNPGTQTASYLLVHKDYFEGVYALSATLAPNKFYEIWSTLYFIDEGLAGLSYKDFILEFYELDQWGNPKIPKEDKIRRFIDERLKPFIVKRDLKAMGVTFDRFIKLIPIDMGEKHKKYYKDVVNTTLGEISRFRNVYDLKAASGMFPLAQLICSDPSIVRFSEVYVKYGNEFVQDWDFKKDNNKFNEFLKLYEKHKDSIILLWTYRPQMSKVLYSEIRDYFGWEEYEVLNSFNYSSLDSLVEDLTEDTKVVIMSIGRFSTGVDLLFSNVSIFWDRSFSYVEWHQAIGRSYRINSQSNVFIYILQFIESIEVTIENYMDMKKSLDSSLKRNLSRKELKDMLFGGFLE